MSKTYSTTIEITEEKEYSVTINAGLDLSSWISAGSTTGYPLNPSSYADFSALEADEAAVRQLMTVHASVDYLAQATAGDSLMESVIGSDVCAKWINLSDYALDTLLANSDIKSVMDTADKYGYGEWGITDSTTTPPTWGVLGNVPIMTANNAPYGTVSYSAQATNYDAYKAFSSENRGWFASNSGYAQNAYIAYEAVNPFIAKRAKVGMIITDSGSQTIYFKIQGSNDGFSSDINDLCTEQTLTASTLNTTTYIDVDLEALSAYKSHRLIMTRANSGGISGLGLKLQFYGRELTPLVPTMTSNTTPKGTAFANTNNSNAYKAFDGNGESSPWNGTAISSATGTDFVGYIFPVPVSVKEIAYQQVGSGAVSRLINATCKLEYSTDGVTYQSAGTFNMSASANKGQESFNSSVKATHWRVFYNSPNYKYTASEYYFYMAELQFYGMDYSEKEFAQGSTRKTIYDHGVILNNTFDIRNFNESYKNIGEKRDYEIYMKSTQSNANPPNYYGRIAAGAEEDLTNYSGVYIRTGMESYMDSQGGLLITTSSMGGTEASVTVTNKKEASLDITSFNTTRWVIVMIGTTGNYYSFNELWLE